MYPEGASPLLREALAKHLKVRPSQVIVGSGSDEIIRLLCEAFLSPEDEVIVSQYGFIRFRQQALLMGARIIEIPMEDWTHDLETMARAVSARTKVVFVASPNNPTGTYNTRDELEALLKRVPPSVIVALDEAYFEFAVGNDDYPNSVQEFLPKYPNLVVMRTFSKIYGLAGLRVGYGIGDEELIGWLDRIRMPFNVSLPAQHAAVEALKDSAFLRRGLTLIEKNRNQLAEDLRDLDFRVVDSAANFLFVEGPLPGKLLFKQLLHYGVIVRSLDEYGLQRHLRISIGSIPAQRALLDGHSRILTSPISENGASAAL
jgi:histidinol-phosphate aminotransferase